MHMHSWVELDAAALRHNYKLFCELLGRERVVPVVKANAYGHGLAETHSILAGLQSPWLAVNYTSEGALLRQWGYRGRVLVVGPTLASDLEVAYQADLEVMLGNPPILRLWRERAQRPRVHIKINTGMGRQGFQAQEAGALIDHLLPAKDAVVGICTHFANVEDVSDTSYAELQLQRFYLAQEAFTSAGFKLTSHAASSASALLLARSRLDLCRVGVSMYGLWPSRLTRLSYLQTNGHLAALQPVLSWKSRLCSVRDVKAGEYIGYGCTYKAPRDLRLGVVAVGYYEGYPRLAGTHGRSFVLIRGQRCPLVGRICMNMLMVDVTGLSSLPLGEVVTLIGQEGEERVTAEDLAEWAQTINYEIVTCLNPAMPRHIQEEAAPASAPELASPLPR